MELSLEQTKAILRLEEAKSSIVKNVVLSNEKAIASATVCSAAEVTRALFGLNNSADATAEKINGGSEHLSNAIKAATDQAAESSKESANLAKKLNKLTIGITIAACLSAAAAVIQSVGIIIQVFHPSTPQVMVVPLMR